MALTVLGIPPSERYGHLCTLICQLVSTTFGQSASTRSNKDSRVLQRDRREVTNVLLKKVNSFSPCATDDDVHWLPSSGA
jgi:hypothetical protein